MDSSLFFMFENSTYNSSQIIYLIFPSYSSVFNSCDSSSNYSSTNLFDNLSLESYRVRGVSLLMNGNKFY